MKLKIFTIICVILVVTSTDQLFEVLERDIDNQENDSNEIINFSQTNENARTSLFDKFEEDENSKSAKKDESISL
jgi:hypothetical protein